ncbi:UDP-3-O-(3-hydroxymyristoyl) glucosamine N-acyltransferase [Myxococcus sp. RHST-1-4]|nr:UDP-3-O-(3-hydroxymyristoyl) glucosamine N-acyltransferase [Myxococcus sp. RHSTA-1-4]
MGTSPSLVSPSAVSAGGAAHFSMASSARVLGKLLLGPGAIIAQGAVIRSVAGSVRLGAGAAVLENASVIGTPEHPAQVGERAVLGHRSIVIGAEVGPLCEVGNGAILMPGARVGARCFVGEGTLIPAGMVVPDESVVVGRPGQVLRRANAEDLERLRTLRGGSLVLPGQPLTAFSARDRAEDAPMGQLYTFRDKHPLVHPMATLFSTAEVMGDVVIGPGSIIGPGVKIVGDSHGQVRIGAGVQVLSNTVLHLLPDNALVLEDGVIIGPGCMVHGCHVGAGTVVEPGAILCDGSRLGRGCLVGAGSLVKQRTIFPDGARVDGFPATQTGTLPAPPPPPRWALRSEDLPGLRRVS